jgi:hypothetical protein
MIIIVFHVCVYNHYFFFLLLSTKNMKSQCVANEERQKRVDRRSALKKKKEDDLFWATGGFGVPGRPMTEEGRQMDFLEDVTVSENQLWNLFNVAGRSDGGKRSATADVAGPMQPKKIRKKWF